MLHGNLKQEENLLAFGSKLSSLFWYNFQEGVIVSERPQASFAFTSKQDNEVKSLYKWWGYILINLDSYRQ